MKSTEKIVLPVSGRTIGKHFSRAYRRGEKIPAVIYGPKLASQSLLIDELAIRKYVGRKFESTIFRLKSDDKAVDQQHVLLKKVQYHPVTQRPEHIDFYAVDMTKPLKVKIEIRFDGKPIGLADGGLLQLILREVEIECLPSDIPEYVQVDVSNLGVNDALHVSDLTLPANVKVISHGHLTIATVSVLADEPEPTAAAAAAPVEGAAPATGAPAAPGAAPAAAAPAAGAKAPAAAKAPAGGGDKKK